MEHLPIVRIQPQESRRSWGERIRLFRSPFQSVSLPILLAVLLPGLLFLGLSLLSLLGLVTGKHGIARSS